MIYKLKTKSGATEAVIDDNCGITKFYAIADALTHDLKIDFLTQVDETENLDWDFKFHDQFLTLHYNVFNGVSILPVSKKSNRRRNNAVVEVAHFLQQKAF